MPQWFPPWLRFHIPLIELDRQISCIRLSEKTSRFRVQRPLQLLNNPGCETRGYSASSANRIQAGRHRGVTGTSSVAFTRRRRRGGGCSGKNRKREDTFASVAEMFIQRTSSDKPSGILSIQIDRNML